MQTIELGLALIRQRASEGSMWLTQASKNQPMLSFVSGSRLEGESFRETISREVAWQLDLERNREFLVANMAQIDLEFEGAIPGQPDLTRLHVAFYSVDLYRSAARQRIAKRDDLVWVPSSVLCEAERFSGWLINPFHQSLIHRSKVIESWY
ncbi:MAG: hypothetical protein JNL67_15450 [Planctomycetaceae bacterium]|nr:hypothetical protein [Planctomycetaceae bacterium]